MRFGVTAAGTERSVRLAPPGERFSMKNLDRLLRKILWILPTVLWPAAVAFAQPQSHAPASSQSSTQSSSQMQSQPPQKEEPASDAAKKAEKEKAKQRRCTPKRIWRACAAMAFPSLGKINRRALPERKRARQKGKRKRPIYPCPAQIKNTGGGKTVVCSHR